MLDELCERLEELSGKLDKMGAFVNFAGPMTHMFRRDDQYQYKTVPAGENRTVFYLRNPNPTKLVGLITEVANDWYPHTYLEWRIDYNPKIVEYMIGNINNPKEFERGIPFKEEVEWIAYNNDTEEHAFGVLCDGFFISREVYERIIKGHGIH